MIHTPETSSTVVGYLELEDIGICEIRLYCEDDIENPHFHIISLNDDNFDCAICIKEAKYYRANNHDNNTYLTSTQAQQLNDFLSSSIDENPQPEIIYFGEL